MAPVNSNTFESGQSSGAAITTGNSGGGAGRAWTSLAGTCTYDTAHTYGGSLAAKIDMAAGTTSQLRWLDGADQAGNVSYLRFYLFLAALPSQNLSVAYFTDHSNTFLMRVRIRANGTVDLIDGATQVMATTTAAAATGQWIRIEAKVTSNAATGSGELRLYNNADSAVATETLTSTAAWNTGSTKPGGWRFGGLTSTAASDVFWLDSVASDPSNWIGPANVRTLGQPAEADTATPVAKSKAGTAGQPTETDTSRPMSRVKTRQLTQPAETDTATPFGHIRGRTVGQANETDLARPIAAAKSRALTQPTETDTAATVSHQRTRTIGQATETATSTPIGHTRARAIGQATEADSAAAIIRAIRVVLGEADETDIATAIGHTRVRAVNQTTEAGTANAIAVRKARVLGQPAELPVALAIIAAKSRTLHAVTETALALPITAPTTVVTRGRIRPRALIGVHMSDRPALAPGLRAATISTIRSGS